ncbi:MAG: UDP-N-acetylmuramate--L-alanine ligase [Microthrixaceae bacterium]
MGPQEGQISPDLSYPRRIHVVAIGGAGMSAIATVLKQQGHQVTGSDQAESEVLVRLNALGITTSVGHSSSHVADAEFLVVSTAVDPRNVELVEAACLGIPVLRRIDLLPALARLQPFISVSGTHGKTTTTSMLAVALIGAEADPSFLVGAQVTSLGVSAAYQSGRHFVLEADESDGSFLAGPRAAALVTNIEPDHLEFWGGWEQLLNGFRKFLGETDGPCVVCADDPVAAQIGAEFDAASYGCSQEAGYRMTDLQLGSQSCSFTLSTPKESSQTGLQVDVRLAVPGLHNATNAAGALALVGELGYSIKDAADSLIGYQGVSRRFEQRGFVAGVHFVDDYAHLPTEIRAALAAAKSGDWNRVVAVFQPHRYSRTQLLLEEFADAFTQADLLVLTEIYAAGEQPRPGVTGRLFFDAVRRAHPESQIIWCEDLDEAARYLGQELASGDLCLSLGAGSVTTLADLVAPILDDRADPMTEQTR